MARLYITGTDTDVGKTAITACLAEATRRMGIDVRAVKPVASGVTPGTPGDADHIARAAGHEPLVFAGWSRPVTPHRAAEAQGESLDVPALRRWLSGISATLVLVEGVGGWRVPLAMAEGGPIDLKDVADELGPVIVVAADRLGVINHARLTVEAVQRDGFPVAAVVLNRGVGDAEDPSRATNLDDLRAVLGVPVVPCAAIDLEDPEARRRAGASIWAALGPPGRGVSAQP